MKIFCKLLIFEKFYKFGIIYGSPAKLNYGGNFGSMVLICLVKKKELLIGSKINFLESIKKIPIFIPVLWFKSKDSHPRVVIILKNKKGEFIYTENGLTTKIKNAELIVEKGKFFDNKNICLYKKYKMKKIITLQHLNEIKKINKEEIDIKYTEKLNLNKNNFIKNKISNLIKEKVKEEIFMENELYNKKIIEIEKIIKNKID